MLAGSIPDSNSVLLSGLVVEHGAALATVTRSADTAASLVGALTAAVAGADLIVISGGVSAGAFDPLTMLAEDRAALDQDRAAGAAIRLRFARVAMQPGRPQGHGTVRADDGREVPLIMLPGNPVSVLVSFRTIVAPALTRYEAINHPNLLEKNIKKELKKELFLEYELINKIGLMRSFLCSSGF